MEGFDIGHAGREDQICVTLHAAHRSGDLKTDRMGDLSVGWRNFPGIGTLCRSVLAGMRRRRGAAKFGYHAAEQHKNFKSQISHG
jgi:hypothetical protein